MTQENKILVPGNVSSRWNMSLTMTTLFSLSWKTFSSVPTTILYSRFPLTTQQSSDELTFWKLLSCWGKATGVVFPLLFSSVKPRCFFSKGAHWERDWWLWPLWCPLFHITSSSRLSKPFSLTIILCVGLTSYMAPLGPTGDFMHMQKSTSFSPRDRNDVEVVDFWLGASLIFTRVPFSLRKRHNSFSTSTSNCLLHIFSFSDAIWTNYTDSQAVANDVFRE